MENDNNELITKICDDVFYNTKIDIEMTEFVAKKVKALEKEMNSRIEHNKGKFIILRRDDREDSNYKYYGKFDSIHLTWNTNNYCNIRISLQFQYYRDNVLKGLQLSYFDTDMGGDFRFYDTEDEAKLACKLLNMNT